MISFQFQVMSFQSVLCCILVAGFSCNATSTLEIKARGYANGMRMQNPLLSLSEVTDWFKAGFTAQAERNTIESAISASGIARQEEAVAAFSAGWNAVNDIQTGKTGDSVEIRGVTRRLMNNRSLNGGNWYWEAFHSIAKKKSTERYSIAILGEQEAQRLAVKARDDEMEFKRRLEDATLPPETRAAIENKRVSAREARKRLGEGRGKLGKLTEASKGVLFNARKNYWITCWN